MTTELYEPMVGTHINKACREAISIARQTHSDVPFEFNEVPLVAKPDSSPEALEMEYDTVCERRRGEYRNSPEGIEAEEIRRGQIVARQVLVDHLTHPAVVNGAINGGLDSVVNLIRELTPPADDVAVKFDKPALADALIAGGYAENEHVGHKPEWFTARDRLGRYIVGQVINCLRSGMPPHPITEKFCKEYEQIPLA